MAAIILLTIINVHVHSNAKSHKLIFKIHVPANSQRYYYTVIFTCTRIKINFHTSVYVHVHKYYKINKNNDNKRNVCTNQSGGGVSYLSYFIMS